MKKLAAMLLVGVVTLGCGNSTLGPGPSGTGGNEGTGGGGGATSCSYTVTGAQSASGTCMAEGYYVPGDTAVDFEVNAPPIFGFRTSVPGIPALSTGTFDNTSVPPGYSGLYQSSTGAVYYLCPVDSCADAQGIGPIPPQGSFMLSISDVGPSMSASGDTTWSAPQGALTVTMPAQPGGAASGTVVVDVTF
jgi:hypothetical protein